MNSQDADITPESQQEFVITFRDGLVKKLRNPVNWHHGIKGEMKHNSETLMTYIPWDSIKYFTEAKG